MRTVTANPSSIEAEAPHRSRWGAWLAAGEPHLVAGPFTRWPHLSDAVLAVLAFVTSLISVTASALADDEDLTLGSIGDLAGASMALLAVAALALLWRRGRPVAVTSVVLVVMVLWALGDRGDGQEVALVLATYSVGRYVSDRRHGLLVLGAVVAISLLGTIVDANQRVDIAPALILAVLPWYVGSRVRNRGDYLRLLQERAERLEAEQEARARQAVADERARIARELHDVVAHRVSMMTVQAGAAKTIAREDLDMAVEAMRDVEHAGRQALGELRHLLGVLRPDATDDGTLGPQPGVNDLPALVDELAHTGAEVRAAIDTGDRALPLAVELSAYRIVQESLTNIVKHAGPRPTVDVAVALESNALHIEITNSIAADRPRLPTSGFGIAGMRERTALLGGTLVATEDPPGTFQVTARLPLQPEPS